MHCRYWPDLIMALQPTQSTRSFRPQPTSKDLYPSHPIPDPHPRIYTQVTQSPNHIQGSTPKAPYPRPTPKDPHPRHPIPDQHQRIYTQVTQSLMHTQGSTPKSPNPWPTPLRIYTQVTQSLTHTQGSTPKAPNPRPTPKTPVLLVTNPHLISFQKCSSSRPLFCLTDQRMHTDYWGWLVNVHTSKSPSLFTIISQYLHHCDVSWKLCSQYGI